MSPRKVRLVADLVRSLPVEEALTQLSFINKAAALPVAKLIKSAIANAEENWQLKRSNLLIQEIKVDEGATLHRWFPRAMGRATPIRKRTSNLTLLLAEIVPTKIKESKNKGKIEAAIKVEDLDELKLLEKTADTEEKNQAVGAETKNKGSQKGFAKKIFNRKSG